MMFGFVTARQFFGIDINPFAVELAKVTMMIARKLAIDELHITEKALPLDNLDDNFTPADALIDELGNPVSWPPTDVIIGNPPFAGAKLLKPERGPDYVNAVRRSYPEIPGMADYCVYWFRKAHDHLRSCTTEDPVAGRAGLVGTQNIRNNQSRVGGLDYVVQSGTIVEAVENQPWSGEANVHVSIANWIKTQDPALVPSKRRLWFKLESKAKANRKKGQGLALKEYEFDVRECAHINSALSDEISVSGAVALATNGGLSYTGQYPRHGGFWLTKEQAAGMLAKRKKNLDVLFPCMIGNDLLTSGRPSRWIIDFQQMNVLESQQYVDPFDHLKHITLPYIQEKAADERRKTKRESGQDQNWLKCWWQHFRPRPELIGKLNRLQRYAT